MLHAVRTHSLTMAVEGQGTSCHPGWLLCHFGPGMGPPLTNVQLGGVWCASWPPLAISTPPKICTRWSGSPRACSWAAPNLRQLC